MFLRAFSIVFVYQGVTTAFAIQDAARRCYWLLLYTNALRSTCNATGIQLYINHTMLMLYVEMQISAGYSTDDEMLLIGSCALCSFARYAGFKVTLSRHTFQRATQLTWLPALRIRAMSLYVCIYITSRATIGNIVTLWKSMV